MKKITKLTVAGMFFLCLSLEPVHGKDQADEKKIQQTQQDGEVLLNENIPLPKFPENIDLTQEFQLAWHFQELSLLYYVLPRESEKIRKAISVKNEFVISLLMKTDYVSMINELRPWWKTKWHVELPAWRDGYKGVSRHLGFFALFFIDETDSERNLSFPIGLSVTSPIPISVFGDIPSGSIIDEMLSENNQPVESDMPGFGLPGMHGSVFGSDDSGVRPIAGMHGSMGAFGSQGHLSQMEMEMRKREEEHENFLYLDDAIYVVSDFFPRPLHAVFISETGGFVEKIYLVACYQCLDEDAYEKGKLDGNSIRLRYLFMGCQPKPLYQGGCIYDPLTKTTITSRFSPTGSIVIFDEQGHPTCYHSVKDGKYFGPQIKWDNEGNITAFHIDTEATQSCANIWLEFARK